MLRKYRFIFVSTERPYCRLLRMLTAGKTNEQRAENNTKRRINRITWMEHTHTHTHTHTSRHTHRYTHTRLRPYLAASSEEKWQLNNNDNNDIKYMLWKFDGNRLPTPIAQKYWLGVWNFWPVWNVPPTSTFRWVSNLNCILGFQLIRMDRWDRSSFMVDMLCVQWI